MRSATEALPTLARKLRPRVVYTDLDGTLFGPGSSLFSETGGDVTTRGAEGIATLHRAGVVIVPMSGRTETQTYDAARAIGAAGFIAEMGGLVWDGRRLVRNYGAHRGRGTPFEAMARSGAAGLLLDVYDGRLEPHAPWALSARECTMLFRGDLDLEAARALLTESGYDWLDLHDNGIIERRFPRLDVDRVHAYHLVPRGVSKAAAAAADLAARQIDPARAVAVGDSPADAALAPHVGAVFVVANGAPAFTGLSVSDNVFLTEGAHGVGFAEVIGGLLG